MPNFSTEGIVLKHSNFGEADRILTILTPFKGKIKVVAKGVRRITSRRAGNVEPLNIVKIQLFQGKGMMILTEAITIQSFSKLKENLLLSAYSSHIMEIADRLLPEDQPNRPVYNLLIATFSLLNEHPRQIFIRAYEVKILTLLGFWSEQEVQTSEEIKGLLRQLQQLDFSEINELQVLEVQMVEVERILRYYMEKVLESPLRSIQVIQSLK